MLTHWQADILAQAQETAARSGRGTIGVCTSPHCGCTEGLGHWVYSPDESDADDPEHRHFVSERKTFTILFPRRGDALDTGSHVR